MNKTWNDQKSAGVPLMAQYPRIAACFQHQQLLLLLSFDFTKCGQGHGRGGGWWWGHIFQKSEREKIPVWWWGHTFQKFEKNLIKKSEDNLLLLSFNLTNVDASTRPQLWWWWWGHTWIIVIPEIRNIARFLPISFQRNYKLKVIRKNGFTKQNKSSNFRKKDILHGVEKYITPYVLGTRFGQYLKPINFAGCTLTF